MPKSLPRAPMSSSSAAASSARPSPITSTKIGITSTVLLERKQLTCGTTWHAAGLVGQLRATRNLTELAKYTTGLFEGLETGDRPGDRLQAERLDLDRARPRGGFEELKRGASMAQELRPRGRRHLDRRDQGAPAALQSRRRGRRRVPAEGRPGQSDRRDAGAGRAAPGSAAPRSSRTPRSTRILVEGRARRRRRDGGRHDPRRQGGDRRRHVVARARPLDRRQHPAACGEHFYIVTEPIDGAAAQHAGGAHPRRMHLLQGGRRQAAGRRLRAGGQALGHGRHPRRSRLRDAARGHGSFRADPRPTR